MLVSIIIPVYNVAPYVEQCIQSVINQTYKNLEVIIVDDCGTDESMEIVERIVSQIPQNSQIIFKILHHNRNRGLSAARNTGIRVAKGEWLYFLDSDDWITDDCIEKMFKKTGNDVEMVIGNYYAKADFFIPPLMLKTGIYKGDILDIYTHAKYYMMAWNKLVRKDFLLQNSLFFKEGIIHEDDLWSFCCACKLKIIAVVDDITLNYRVRNDGIQRESDYETHYRNFGSVVRGMIEYFSVYGAANRSLAYHFLLLQLDCIYMNAHSNNHPQLANDFYKSLRTIPFWRLKDVFCNSDKIHGMLFFFRHTFSLPLLNKVFKLIYFRRYAKWNTWYVGFF